MKPAWDKLMADFENSPTSLVADVDCTAEGKPLCDKNSVSGFPTIKYGDVSDMKQYNGGRDYDSLKKFADENLGPQCGPANLDLCSGDVKGKYEKYMGMSADRLESKGRMIKKNFEEELPIIQKTVGWVKKNGGKKEEL